MSPDLFPSLRVGSGNETRREGEGEGERERERERETEMGRRDLNNTFMACLDLV